MPARQQAVYVGRYFKEPCLTMMFYSKISFIILLITSVLFATNCRSTKAFNQGWVNPLDYAYNFVQLPDSCFINSKTISFDTTESRNLKKCDEIATEINTANSCIVTKGNKRFIKIFTAVFDKSQTLREIESYLPMGRDIHTIQDLTQDTTLFNSFNISKAGHFKIDKNKLTVIDNLDTLPIVDVWTKEKLIFVSVDKIKHIKIAKGQTIIYGFD